MIFGAAMTEDDARPEALRRFELMVKRCTSGAQNTAAAKKSASDASTFASECGNPCD
ncbi:prophage tail fiber N-terminal domain-containing protein [Salmonella enterica subsp. enterica]|nr:prophage tail fiber N-terminal domain-containing protein [Salmonella enterica subsp. enterica]